MSPELEWFEAYPQPKVLNRQPGYWLCLLNGGPATVRGHGDSPEEAIQDAQAELRKPPTLRNRPTILTTHGPMDWETGGRD